MIDKIIVEAAGMTMIVLSLTNAAEAAERIDELETAIEYMQDAVRWADRLIELCLQVDPSTEEQAMKLRIKGLGILARLELRAIKAREVADGALAKAARA